MKGFLNRRRSPTGSSADGNRTTGGRTSTSNTRDDHGRSQDTTADNEAGGMPDSEYARRRRELLRIARDLRALGASESTLEIPRLAVIGAQSAGKSSLVEAVTGVKVPRDDGMCTRCPMECTILSAEQWSCKISLRTGKSTADQQYSPPLGPTDDVELWIRRAQATVLCPHLPDDTFKEMGREEIKVKTNSDADPNVFTVTKSVVVIDIEDPSGADLSFVDLPGLVQNEDTSVVKLVKDLVVEYISSPSTFILVTIPAGDDMENQQAAKLAKEADPEGKRTIGVVTKPDTVLLGASGARKKWQDIFEGRVPRHRLELGYYAVRLPLDDERKQGCSREDLRKISGRFFAETVPWKDIQVPGRLGVDMLVHDISRLLMDLLYKALPRLEAQVVKLLATCRADLDTLPKPLVPTKGSIAEVFDRIVAFCADLRDVVYGRAPDKSLVRRSRHAFLRLKQDLRCTAPDFRPFERPQDFQRPPDPEYLKAEDEISARFDSWFAIPGEDSSFTGRDVPSPIHSASVSFSELASENLSTASSVPVKVYNAIGLYDVRKIIKECTGWQLPFNVPYEAKERLIKMFVDRWTAPTRICFDRIEELVVATVIKLASHHFTRFPLLKDHLLPLVLSQLNTYVERSASSVEDVLAREDIIYLTLNMNYLKIMRERWHNHYKFVRHRQETYRISDMRPSRLMQAPTSSLTSQEKANHVAKALEALRHLGYNLTAEDFPRALPPDEFEEEILVMAEVRSFFQVTYKRVIDALPTAILHDFVRRFADGLQEHLLERLDASAEGAAVRFEQLLKEDPEVERKRQRLLAQEAKLREIKAKLENYRA